jgi:hypothetical protein
MKDNKTYEFCFDLHDSQKTNREAFDEFHALNPEVYAELRKLALGLRHLGRKRYGIAGLFEVVRWQRAIVTTGDESFKLNNNFKAFFARLLMKNEPELRNFFDLRASKADE